MKKVFIKRIHLKVSINNSYQNEIEKQKKVPTYCYMQRL